MSAWCCTVSLHGRAGAGGLVARRGGVAKLTRSKPSLGECTGTTCTDSVGTSRDRQTGIFSFSARLVDGVRKTPVRGLPMLLQVTGTRRRRATSVDVGPSWRRTYALGLCASVEC